MKYHESYYNEMEDGLSSALTTLKELGPQKAVDIGCGFGKLGVLLADSGWEVCLVDPDEYSVEKAQESGGEVIQSTAQEFLLENRESFDGVILRNSIDYMSEEELILLQDFLRKVSWAYVTWCPAEELDQGELNRRRVEEGQFCRTTEYWNTFLQRSGLRWKGDLLWNRVTQMDYRVAVLREGKLPVGMELKPVNRAHFICHLDSSIEGCSEQYSWESRESLHEAVRVGLDPETAKHLGLMSFMECFSLKKEGVLAALGIALVFKRVAIVLFTWGNDGYRTELLKELFRRLFIRGLRVVDLVPENSEGDRKFLEVYQKEEPQDPDCEICKAQCCRYSSPSEYDVIPDFDVERIRRNAPEMLSKLYRVGEEWRFGPKPGTLECVFLDEDCRCSIYPFKPTYCTEFPVGGKLCVERWNDPE